MEIINKVKNLVITYPISNNIILIYLLLNTKQKIIIYKIIYDIIYNQTTFRFK